MPVSVATTLDDALSMLVDGGCTPLAGGTDLMVQLNERHRSAPERVVVVNRIPELRTWSHDPESQTLTLGAAVTWSEIEREPIARWVPSLAQAARTVGSPQIRHAGTIGGNLATSSPAGDGLPPLASLGAVVHLRSAGGARSVPFAEFMVGPKRTVRRDDELITAVTVPVIDGWQGYSKVGVRNAMVISTASAALVVDRSAGTARLSFGSVGPVIIRCTEAEEWIAERVDLRVATAQVDSSLTAEFASKASAAARPIDDHRSTAAYRRHAVGVLAARLLRGAFPNG